MSPNYYTIFLINVKFPSKKIYFFALLIAAMSINNYFRNINAVKQRETVVIAHARNVVRNPLIASLLFYNRPVDFRHFFRVFIKVIEYLLKHKFCFLPLFLKKISVIHIFKKEGPEL